MHNEIRFFKFDLRFSFLQSLNFSTFKTSTTITTDLTLRSSVDKNEIQLKYPNITSLFLETTIGTSQKPIKKLGLSKNRSEVGLR